MIEGIELRNNDSLMLYCFDGGNIRARIANAAPAAGFTTLMIQRKMYRKTLELRTKVYIQIFLWWMPRDVVNFLQRFNLISVLCECFIHSILSECVVDIYVWLFYWQETIIMIGPTVWTYDLHRRANVWFEGYLSRNCFIAGCIKFCANKIYKWWLRT